MGNGGISMAEVGIAKKSKSTTKGVGRGGRRRSAGGGRGKRKTDDSDDDDYESGMLLVHSLVV